MITLRLRISTRPVLFFELVAALVVLLSLAVGLFAQTKADANQIKNLQLLVSPIKSVERFQCVNPTAPPGANCGGLQMIRVTLADGTALRGDPGHSDDRCRWCLATDSAEYARSTSTLVEPAAEDCRKVKHPVEESDHIVLNDIRDSMLKESTSTF